MRWAWVLGALLAWTAPLTATDREDPARLRYCSLTHRCGLPAPAEWCPAPYTRGVNGVTYDESRCHDARILHARGVGTEGGSGYRLYQFLGARYQVVYAVEGEVRLSPARMAFLVDDLPLAAKLLSRFQPTSYAAEYLEPSKRRFRGSRGKNLSGEVELISGSTAEGRLYYFGRGVSQVAFWKLSGISLMELDYAPAAGGSALRYRMRILTTPASGAINVIMKMGLFRRVVEGQIRDVVADVTEASRRLESGGLPALGPQFSPEERARLDAFLNLP